MKTLSMPTTTKEFKKLADAALVEGNVVAALRYVSSALKVPDISKKELGSLKRDYARILSMRCKYGFSNAVLFEVLSTNPKDKEALSLIMYNCQALGLDDVAQYYFEKCKGFLDKKKKQFLNFLDEAPGDTLMINGEEIPLESITEESVDEFLGGDLLKQIKAKKESIFEVIDDRTRFQDYISKMYDSASKQDYAAAIDYANQALKLNVPESDKVIANYTKSVTLMFMGYERESLELVNKTLEKHPDDYSLRMLKCELLSSMKDIQGLRQELKYFASRPKDEVLPFDRIVTQFLKHGLYDDGLEFVKPRIKFFSDSYTLCTYLAILYLDKGEIEKAKAVLFDLNGLYGDLCDARHLINYINYGIKRPILVSPLIGEITELTIQYSNEFCAFLQQQGMAAATWATFDIPNFVAKFRWIAKNRRIDLAIAIVEKMYMISSHEITKEENVKLRELKREIVKLLATDEDLPLPVKECITHYAIITDGKINIAVDGKFFVADPMLDIYALPVTFLRAIVRAFAFAIARGEGPYLDTLRFVSNLNGIYQERKFNWKSEDTITALIIYYSFNNQDLEDLIPGIKFNKKLFSKYVLELSNDEIQ